MNLSGKAALALLLALLTGDPLMSAEPDLTRFEISISEQQLEDLQRRLDNSRMPDQITETTWEYGTDSVFLSRLLDYWRNDYDWRAQEQRLNQFDQFRMNIDGLGIHFIHQRSANPDAVPLLLVHGWPGSFAEFSRLIDPLTDPSRFGGEAIDAFHVIAPSLPGFGFSDKPTEPGFNPERIAHLLAKLMENLGYDRYALQGGDWGAIINRYIAGNYPDRLIGLHSNFVLAGNPGTEDPAFAASPEELERQMLRESYMQNERAYQQIQGSKPQTLGYGLNDSPAGLAAWIVEKFHGWSDIPQDQSLNLLDKFSLDDLLTNISIYWHTQTITSSMRIYFENRNVRAVNPIAYVSVPTGGAIFPAELSVTPRGWAARSFNIVHWTVMPRGGHFAAMEEPELLIQDIRSFFRTLRPTHQ